VRAESERLPADTLALSTSNIWRVIKSQKDLNLPAHKVREGLHKAWCGGRVVGWRWEAGWVWRRICA
jgi:hypothetical protein